MVRHTNFASVVLFALGLSACAAAPSPAAGKPTTAAETPPIEQTEAVAPEQVFSGEPMACKNCGYANPQWSPDGKWIVYMTTGEAYDVRRIHPDGTGDEMLVAGVNVALLSPDGKYLLYREIQSDEFVYVVDLTTGQSKQIGQHLGALGWLPDSQSVAVTDPSGEYVRIRIDTLASEPVPGAPDDIKDAVNPPAWTPDGSAFAYDGLRDGVSRSVIVDAATGSETLIAEPERQCDSTSVMARSWSPDGRMLALLHWCDAEQSLWIALRDGTLLGDLGVLPSGSQQVAALRWSPDSKQIAYTVQSAGTQVFVAYVDGSNTRLLSEDALDPVWSPDGKQLAFVGTGASGRQEIIIINADGSDRKQITRSPNPPQ